MTTEEEDCEAAYDEGFADGRRFGRTDISELLEALEDLCSFETPLTQEKWDKARDVIAKARGEA